MGYKETYNEWLTSSYFDENTKNELKNIKDEKEIEDRFYCDLEFGTGGLRGVIGAGTNRMNIYTVRKATQGFANYIIKQSKQSMGVAIACDSRNMSYEFSEEAALCLAANGIKSYVFESLRPTPELSFSVRHLGCVAGINITASHNPSEYNGYKAYFEDGAQVTPPHDENIMAEVENIKNYSEVKTMDKETAVKNGLYISIGKEVDDAYIEMLKKYTINKGEIEKYSDSLKIVYTPLNGAGNILARRILKEIGFNNVTVVPEQELPDGNFPTCKYPNPEFKEAYEYALKLANEISADLIVATDPDSDRLGVCVRDTNGEYHILTGNMVGCLIAEYLLSQNKNLPKDGVLVRSIVSSTLIDTIAENYNVRAEAVLTGFKWTANKMRELEINKSGTFIFGFEESIGYLLENEVRDKDAIGALMIVAEILCYAKSQGKTLWDYMIDIYKKYGYYIESSSSTTFKGVEGKEIMKNMMENLRANPLNKVGKYNVLKVKDYKLDTVLDLTTKETTPTGLPSSNVLYYELENNGWMCVRPSGTEPKIKFYFGLKGTSLENANELAEDFKKDVTSLVESIQ